MLSSSLRLKKEQADFSRQNLFIFIVRRQETAKLVKDNRFTLNIISMFTQRIGSRRIQISLIVLLTTFCIMPHAHKNIANGNKI